MANIPYRGACGQREGVVFQVLIFSTCLVSTSTSWLWWPCLDNRFDIQSLFTSIAGWEMIPVKTRKITKVSITSEDIVDQLLAKKEPSCHEILSPFGTCSWHMSPLSIFFFSSLFSYYVTFRRNLHSLKLTANAPENGPKATKGK